VFLAQRGAWNRTQKTGYRVMMVTLRNGSVLVSDDYTGAIYRIIYQK
jgi:glucose/arabinose dehydrogenase